MALECALVPEAAATELTLDVGGRLWGQGAASGPRRRPLLSLGDIGAGSGAPEDETACPLQS